MAPIVLPERFEFDGSSVAWGQLGEGDPLVLIHGTPFSSQVWHRIAPVLATRYEVFMFDLLGYGLSDKAGEVSLGIQNRLLAELLDMWALSQPYVIAHDFGGATALRAHLLNGCDYRKFLLLDAVAIRPWGSPFVAHVKEYEQGFAGVPDYIQRAILAAYIRGASHAGLTDAALLPHVVPWLGDDGRAAFYRQIAQMDMTYTDEVESLYGNITCPVSILWGEEDAWIPITTGRRFAKMIPGARFQAVPDAGHLVQEDAPEVVLAEAFQFFSETSQ